MKSQNDDRRAGPVVESAATAKGSETSSGPEKEKSALTGVVTDCMRLNIRDEANLDSAVVTIISALSEVTVDIGASTSDFYRVRTADGVEGFCMRKYIALRR